MMIKIRTRDRYTAREMRSAVLRRDCYRYAQDTDFLRDFVAGGEGYTMSGRKLVFVARFIDGIGNAVLTCDAKGSSGGILMTLLEEIYSVKFATVETQKRLRTLGYVDEYVSQLDLGEDTSVEIDGLVYHVVEATLVEATGETRTVVQGCF